MSFSGHEVVFTGANSPLAMMRSVASPDADTPSYPPDRMRSHHVVDVLPILTVVLQPVLSSNGFTQLYRGGRAVSA